MFEDLLAVAGVLRASGIPHALVGAAAMAGLGIVRASDDLDLLVADAAVLDGAFWAELARGGLAADVRRGDEADPLAGVVRVSRPGGTPVDVVVAKRVWQREVVARARPLSLGIGEVPVVRAADLVLLKLYAGGPQDAADVRLILAALKREAIAPEVEAGLVALPPEASALWRRIAAEG